MPPCCQLSPLTGLLPAMPGPALLLLPVRERFIQLGMGLCSALLVLLDYDTELLS